MSAVALNPTVRIYIGSGEVGDEYSLAAVLSLPISLVSHRGTLGYNGGSYVPSSGNARIMLDPRPFSAIDLR